MNLTQLKAKFPNASEAFLKRNGGKFTPIGYICRICDRMIYEHEASDHSVRGLAHSACLYETPSDRPIQNPLLEPPLCHDALGKAQGKEKCSGKTLLRITSFRVRPIDPDNLAGGAKYIIDSLRYADLIHDDSPDHITLTVDQVKCGKGEERTEIEIETI